MRASGGGLGFRKRTGSGRHEGHYVANEVEAVHVIRAQNRIMQLAKRQERADADKAKIRAKITLPKLKFMGEK